VSSQKFAVKGGCLYSLKNRLAGHRDVSYGRAWSWTLVGIATQPFSRSLWPLFRIWSEIVANGGGPAGLAADPPCGPAVP
jgi:hypothetical protein